MSRTSRQKTRRRRTVKPLRRNATAPAGRTSDKKKVALLARQLTEALEHQTATSRELSESLEREKATSQVLGIISSSPTDLEPVFETILANATRLCEASYGTLWLCEGDAIRAVALHGLMPTEFAEQLRRTPVFHLDPAYPIARAASTRQTVHVADACAEQAYRDRYPLTVAAVELAGVRTLIIVPML